MGNMLGRVSEEMPGSRPRGQVSTMHDHFQASNGDFLAPHPNAGDAAAGALARDLLNVETTYASVSVSRNCKTNSATKKDLSVESFGHPLHPSSLPEGVQFLLYTLPVKARWVGDGGGFTAYVDTADPREAADVPQEVHEALSARAQTRRHKNYQRRDALLSSAIDKAGYKIVNGSNNQEILARKYRIRMRRIDAPELKMKYGMESKNELVKLIGWKCVEIHVYGTDQYGRYVGDIYCDGVFIQEQMLKRGFAWHFKIYDKRCEFGQWEREARAARRGLWLSDNPKKPWEWRRDQRNAEKQDGIQMANGSCEALSRMMKEKKNAEEKARERHKEWQSAVAENRMLKDSGSCEALSRIIKEKKNAEEKAREREKEWESVVAENRMLNDLIRELEEEIHKEKTFKQLVKQMAVGVGTSMLIFGIAVLFRKGKTPPKKNGVALLVEACKQLLM